jgi:hypothetical protein
MSENKRENRVLYMLATGPEKNRTAFMMRTALEANFLDTRMNTTSFTLMSDSLDRIIAEAQVLGLTIQRIDSARNTNDERDEVYTVVHQGKWEGWPYPGTNLARYRPLTIFDPEQEEVK